jgi:hypothetical protein
MATQYHLKAANNSSRDGDFCVFTTFPGLKQGQVASSPLAWLNKFAFQNGRITFDWSSEYSFVWYNSGKIMPGVRYHASETMLADPEDANSNRAYLEWFEGKTYRFHPDRKKANEPIDGGLIVTCAPSLPDRDASVGIAIGGSPAMIVPAGPRLDFTFLPHPTYWIAFGKFDKGEVLDLNTMTNIQKVEFASNQFEKEVILNPDNTWTVN